MATWSRHFKDFEIFIIDYSNLYDVIPKGSIDINLIKHLPLAIQKDAIQASVLKFNGGIFIDADMLVINNPFPILNQLSNYDVITFSSHLAFMVAKPNTLFLDEWHDEVLKKIDMIDQNSENIKWNYFGNSIVNKKMKRKKYKAFRIDKFKSAFMPEINFFRNRGNVIKLYENFWFSNEIELNSVFFANQSIVALHNTWTPKWYRDMSEKEILNHPSLLSRTLKYLIENGIPSKQNQKEVSMFDYFIIQFNRYYNQSNGYYKRVNQKMLKLLRM